MILAAFLLMQAAAPAAPAVTIEQRLATFRGTLRDGGGCAVRRSTGDAAIDRIGCAAVETCEPQYRSRYAGSGDRAIQPGTRKVMRAALAAERDQCVRSVHARMAAEMGRGL